VTSGIYDVWRDRIDEWLKQESPILYGTSVPKITPETFASPAITGQELGQSERFSSSAATADVSTSVSKFYEENGKTAMIDKSIYLNQGGDFGFTVSKVILPDGSERFSVGFRGSVITHERPWAEASAAVEKFRDELETAFEALVQISTLKPIGVHEES
jgi:hypothetical protein